MKKLILLCTTAVVMPTAAFAQSTGSVDFEKEIVVTGTRVQEVGGVQTPDTPKAKVVLTQEAISRSTPGQTILDTINLVPGVSFQNNDAYGSSGGTLNIRGFDSSRISLTFDGIPLNDSGNYAIYSNQQLDPELIEQVNVNLGTTDVDSPTASAVGGTVNYRTMLPQRRAGGQFSASIGQFDFRRVFGVLHTGEIGPWGTRAFISASSAKNDNPFNNYGKVDKQQYNARIYQPLGASGDFISLAGHYNQNRNNFFGSLPLRTDAGRVVGSGSANRYPTNNDEREYDINFPCTIDVPQAGVADAPNTCGTEFDRRYNPSNTGNIRAQSLFNLTDSVVFTLDGSYQSVKANGGGTVSAREFGYDINPTGGRANCAAVTTGAGIVCAPGYYGGSPYAGGVDLNGDGDIRDTVTAVAPSQTRTHRYVGIAGVRWDLNPTNTVRASYTFDRANHRQTGEVGLVDVDGEPMDVFPVNDAVAGSNGINLQKRDRQSYAILHQISGEYRGEFGPLTVQAGVRAPFFKRELENNCFTSSASGFVECSGGDPTIDGQLATLNPYVVDPVTGRVVSGFAPGGKRTLKYNKLLPNIGFTYDVMRSLSVFGSYAKGISVPGTDNLYNAYYFPEGSDSAKPDPEITNSFDLGLRYRSSKIQAQVSGWFTRFDNRLASAYDPELNATVYRNLGRVTKHGIDGSIAYEPFASLRTYVFGSWNKSKIKEDLSLGTCTAAQVTAGILGCTATGQEIFADLSGNREAGTPKYTYGASVNYSIGPVDLGVIAKRTGPRFIYDDNRPVFAGSVAAPAQVYDATADAYWLVNLDARVNIPSFTGSLNKSFVQFNVYNLFDKFYVGGFGGGLTQPLSGVNYGSVPNVQVGAPRTFSASLTVGF
ncbi:TonB-dependent receptor [Sphingomonas sp. LY29]|uniref:TonB-dependent receptor n=1 Tax=Sphingomonas sp. LY29 TaxID=3095341 RepID=UPI002D77B77A|nr:TonB-dependent receptor [Sphingomonas sp. LY29]WRP26329.1 TonB-dependent receptor [Sphingomonas sp. LY29]